MNDCEYFSSDFRNFIGQSSDPLSETDSASEIEPSAETSIVNSKTVVTILPKQYLKLKAQQNEGHIAPLIDVKPPPNVKKFNFVMQDGELKKKRKKYYVCAVANCKNVQGLQYFHFPSEKRYPERQ